MDEIDEIVADAKFLDHEDYDLETLTDWDQADVYRFVATWGPRIIQLASEVELLQKRIVQLESALRSFQFRDGHFAGCIRSGLGGKRHHDHHWKNGNEPATACDDHCWAAHLALNGNK